MNSISKSIYIMKNSNYFDAWSGVLLSDSSVQEWEYLLANSSDDNVYIMLAEKLHAHSVPYVIVSEYIDEFFRYYMIDSVRHIIKNKIAEAYLKKKLTEDNRLLNIELNKKISISIESKQELINAHLNWMKNFICSIIGKPVYYELDPKKCYVGEWLLEEKDDVSEQLVVIHKNLHSMAQSAIRMYNQNDYAYFLLLYTDMLSSSYQIRDTILNIYYSRRLTSIYQDPLSNAGNYFQLKLDISNSKNKNTIMMFNIKEFSKINLLYGHDNGDKIIKEIIDIVNGITNVGSTYRIYADEFAAMFLTKNKKQVITDINSRLHQYEFVLPNSTILLSFYESVADVTEHVLEYCEYGLMMSKHHYGDLVDVNSISQNVFEEYANEVTQSQQLRLAFLDNRIKTYYQPIMNMKTLSITKYEVLMRVKDINSNIIEPANFLNVLKEMYIYPEVTKLIIKNSFDFFKTNSFDFSINLSFADIVNENTQAFILTIIKEYPEVSSRCTFELLENEAILNDEIVNTFFRQLRQSGVKIALDDFGVGYSNYDTIFKFDIDYIKIDGSLTESILTSSKSKVLVESITTVAQKLGAKVIVEFVSSKEIFDVLSEMDVDYVQGYYIGKPAKDLV